MKLKMVYQGRTEKGCIWQVVDKDGNLQDYLRFDKSKRCTDFIVGQVVEIECSDDITSFKFHKVERLYLWEDSALVDEWRLRDAVIRKEQQTKMAENKMKKELGRSFEDMSLKELRDLFFNLSYVSGAKRRNAIAVVLEYLGL